MVKKVGSDSINSKLGLVMKSGKYVLGYKSTLRSLRNGEAKLIILSNNCPTIRRLRSNTMPYSPKLALSSTPETTFLSELHAENITAAQPWPLSMPEIQIFSTSDCLYTHEKMNQRWDQWHLFSYHSYAQSLLLSSNLVFLKE